METNQGSLADLAYQKLKQRILSLEFLPGQVVSDFKLREELNMSRTPIKEALMHLKSDGLILDLGKKGYEVRRITEDDIIDLFDAREGIECAALKISMLHGISPDVLDHLRHLNTQVAQADEQRDYEKVFDFDSELHVTLLEASGNSRLIEYYRMILLQLRRMRLLTYFEKKLPKEAAKEHSLLFSALAEQNTELALKTLSRHIQGTKEDYVRILRKSIRTDTDFVALRYLIRNNLEVQPEPPLG